jgi:hypothetical protein
MNMIADLLTFLRLRRVERRDKAERVAIAKAFNDRYTYRHPYRKGDERRQFTPAEGLDDWFPDQAWMCPCCNTVHMTIGRSLMTGMHFPSCCAHPEGHRHFDKIRMRK